MGANAHSSEQELWDRETRLPGNNDKVQFELSPRADNIQIAW